MPGVPEPGRSASKQKHLAKTMKQYPFGVLAIVTCLSAGFIGCGKSSAPPSVTSSTDQVTSATAPILSRDEIARLSKDLASGNTNGIDLASSVSKLALCVESNDRETALIAVVALGNAGPAAKDAVHALTNLLGSSKNKSEEAAIINTLRKIGPGAKEAVPALRDKSKSLDPVLRLLSQRALEKIQGSE